MFRELPVRSAIHGSCKLPSVLENTLRAKPSPDFTILEELPAKDILFEAVPYRFEYLSVGESLHIILFILKSLRVTLTDGRSFVWNISSETGTGW